ncbi:MAG: SDR family oxidoreductase [Betaproteobacteria bacterium]
MSTLQGKVAWITGAGTGIGLAGAQALAASGATVILSGRRGDVLEREAASIRQANGKAEVEVLDVADANAVKRVADAILQRHRKVDVLVNSAGVNTTKRYWHEQTVEGWQKVVAINLNGTFYCTHAVLHSMRAQKDGVVINISSWAGVYHASLPGAAYNGSKHGVVALTETINIEEGINGIRACVICPAEVATPILDLRPVPPPPEERERMLASEDLGHTIRWVAELPPRVCINEIIISPTWNRIYIGAADLTSR